jgi:pimeloyl-ACP methyl ester carboxylesterase
MRQIVYELHTLLDKAGVKPPLVLVGHSYGGWLVRLYASSYPKDVAGLVLIEPAGDNPWRMLGNGKLVRAADITAGQPIPAVKNSGPLRVSDIPPAALQQMKAAAQENAADPNPPPRNKLPADAQRMRAWALAQLGHIAAAVNPFEGEELAGFREERARNEHPLGSMPLIVLTRGIPAETGANAKTVEEDHRRDNESLATMSLNGKLIIAQHSGHHVQLDEPDLVIKSIREVLAVLKK